MAAYKWRWPDQGLIADSKLSPNQVGRELERLNKKHGDLTADIVIEDAQRKASPFHKALWGKSDEELAARQRKRIAGKIIKSVSIVRRGTKRTVSVPAYMKRGAEKGWDATVDILDDDALYEENLLSLVSEAQDWVQRASDFAELGNVVRELTLVIKSVNGSKKKRKVTRKRKVA